MFRFLFLFIVVLPVFSSQSDVIDVTGGARCSDTTRFLKRLLRFHRELVPFPSNLTINFRPNVSIEALPNGTQIATCRRGEFECELSKFQVCSKNFLPEDVALPTIGCIQGVNTRAAAEDCVAKTSESASIQLCVDAYESTLLLAEEQRNGPPGSEITWVPWILINGKRVAEAEKDPKKYICQLESVEKHNACK